MKKAKLTILLASIGVGAVGIGALALGLSQKDYVDIVFPTIDGIEFVSDDLNKKGQAKLGSELSFTLDLSSWSGSKNTNFKLLANGKELTRAENGEYTVTVTEAITLSFADVTVTFNEAEGVEYLSEYGATVTVPFNTALSFGLDISPFYTADSAIVRAGSRIVDPDSNGIYTVHAVSDMAINVLEVVEMDTNCTTGGTSNEDPFFIYTPADWKFVADQINSGNPNYVNAYYQLAADIDFKGETIPVMGDASDVGGVQTYFGGYFNGMGYTVSNFKIEEHDTPYVGLFGYVVADLEDTNFGIILDLKVSDFTISASMNRAQEEMLCVGSIIGCGIGANLLNCSVSNGSIEVNGNDYYSSFAGGAIGLLQTAFLDFGSYQSRVSSQVAYVSVTNTDVYAISGFVPAVGGVVGYTYVPDYLSTASLINCYANNVFTYGAIHTGGIVGQLGAYSSVFNSYATGSVTANTNISDLANMADYCHAYGGGIVGYAENETAVVNCFSTASVDASAVLGASYQTTSGTIAKIDPANTHDTDAIVAYQRNNHYALGGVDGNVNLTSPDYIFDTLGWYEFDWTYSLGGEYPTFNYDSNYTDGFALTTVFVGTTVSNLTSYSVGFESYAPLSFALISSEVALQEFMLGDNDQISYGYFFDEACTQRIPYSYLFAAQEETIYIGFISYNTVAGTYEMQISTGDTASLILNTDGSYEYEDGGITSGGLYRYDGKQIIFENARFARYANGGNVSGDIYMLDFYTFKADIRDGNLYIYDGTYFTETKPLVALSSFGFEGEYYLGNTTYVFAKDWTVKVGNQKLTYSLNGNTLTLSNGVSGTYNDGVITLDSNALQQADQFKGEWVVSASVNYKLSFDGKGVWTLVTFGYETNGYNANYKTYSSIAGTYTVSNQVATLTETGSSNTYTVSLDDDGYLVMLGSGVDMSFGRADGYAGDWVASFKKGDVVLHLNGITIDGSGMGEIEYWDGNVYPLFYAMEYGRITLYNDVIVFGYMTYNTRTNTLTAYLYDSDEAIIDEVNAYTFYHYDAFLGEWVGEFEGLGSVTFNGFGNYNAETNGLEGLITINEEKVTYTVNADSLSGNFVYDGVSYSIEYNPSTGVIVIENTTTNKTYERKDEFAGLVIVDTNGTEYIFDGRGSLENGGNLTVTTTAGAEEKYTYKINGNTTYIYKDSAQYATIAVVNNVYVWTAGSTSINLYTKNHFVGTWVVSASYSTITVHPMNVAGEMQVQRGGVTRTAVYDKETGICTYGNEYLVPLKSGGFAISASAELGTSYTVCASADELFGSKWTKKGFTSSTNTVITFDGLGKSEEASGAAKRTFGGATTLFSYEYLADYGTYRMYDGANSIMIIEFCDVTTSGAYVNESNTMAFLLSNIDELYMAQAVEEATGYTFTFDGKYTYSTSDGGTPGTVTVTDADGNVVTTYKYLLTNRVPTLFKIEMTLTADDGTKYNAVFSYAEEFVITLELAE